MAIVKLFRVVVRQRVNWSAGLDITVPESRKPLETEGYSVERDITDYVENYKFTQQRGSFAFDATVDIINPLGTLTPSNADSPLNWSTVNGVNTYSPILAEGNELQIYRIAQDLDPNVRANWVPRFRGKIRIVETGTAGGQDTLRLTVGSVLSELSKRTMVGVFSPKMFTTSVVPANSFYSLSTLTSAVGIFRNVNIPTQIPRSYTTTSRVYGEPSTPEPGEMSADLLSKLLYWDKEDYFYANLKYLAPPYFSSNGTITYSSLIGSVSSPNPSFADERTETAKTAVPVQDSTASAVWNLNGQAWFVESGTVTKDATQVFEAPEGSLKLSGGILRFDLTRLPTSTISKITFGFKITDSSTVRVKIDRVTYDRRTYTYSNRVTVVNSLINGPTTFDAVASYGGLCLNPPSTTAYEWRKAQIAVPEIPIGTFEYDMDDTHVITIYQVRLEVSGLVWIDLPAWEFLSVDKTESDTAVFVNTNILDLPRLERWTTDDGLIYRSPYPRHRVMSKRNNRARLRYWGAPYASGTAQGFGPNNLKNRALPETTLYEREMAEGTDFETLYEKGAIMLQTTFRRNEVLMSGTYYDMAESGHMEASAMLKHIMIESGIPSAKISLETTGVILSKISLGVDTSMSSLRAIRDILGQLPGNYHFFEDGDGNVIGRFIQQSGSPRIYNPVIQVPISQDPGGVLIPGGEYWYGMTALMSDGKETLLSNMTSTVPYQDYYDFQHNSIVIPGSCPGFKIKPVPNMVGLVVRRAKAYKTAADMLIHTAPKPKYVFPFETSVPADLLKEDLAAAGKTGTPVALTDSGSAFQGYKVGEIVSTVKK